MKPYVKRGKTDRIDAEAICEAASRPTMRFVPAKTIEQQSLAALHRCRDLLVKNRTMLVNALRAHLAEFGFVAAKGIGKLPDLIEIVSEAPAEALPEMVRAPLSGFIDAIALINQKLDGARESGFGPGIRATRKASAWRPFRASGLSARPRFARWFRLKLVRMYSRHFAAGLGLRQGRTETGGKVRLETTSRKQVMALYAGCSCWAQPHCCARSRNKTTPLALWSRAFWPGAPGVQPPWRWPTNSRALPGPSWRAARLISRFPRQRNAECRRGAHERPDPLNPGAVLAAVNTASRRVPRWPCGQC